MVERPPLATGRIALAALRRALRVASVAFLALPLLVFGLGWLRPAVAALFAAALVAAAAGLLRARRDPASGDDEGSVSLLGVALGLAPCAVLSLLSGAGGLGVRTWDWAKHDAILRDLVAGAWPVQYVTSDGPVALVYYVAYYLPAALAGKLAGPAAADAVLAATSLAGVLLAALWVVVLARGAPVLCGWLFAVFSGMDVVGAALRGPWPPHIGRLLATYHLEWWTPYWQYSSTPSLVNFVPGQAIAGWLLTALLVDAVQRGRPDFPWIAWVALGLLWSPLVVLGLVPLAAVAARRTRGDAGPLVRASAANVGGALIAAVLALYYASRLLPIPLPGRYHPASPSMTGGDFRLLPLDLPLSTFLVAYVPFVVCEFGLLWALLLREHRSRGGDPALRPLLLAAGATLLVLPMFHYGLYNDLVMRASIPALFVLMVATAQALRRGVRGPAALAIAAVVAVGALYGGSLLRAHAGWAWRSQRLASVSALRPVRNLFQMQLFDDAARRNEFVAQYLGAADAPFFRFLARPGVPLAVEVPDPLGGRPDSRQ